MKISAAIIATLATSSTAFTPPQQQQQHSSTTKLYSTIEKPTTAAPERTAPSAGYEPEWEGRTGLSPDEFMNSDMNKPDLSGMWECPLTLWDSEG